MRCAGPTAAGAGHHGARRSALEAGYADQAQMTAEVTRLAGIPLVRFLTDRSPTAA